MRMNKVFLINFYILWLEGALERCSALVIVHHSDKSEKALWNTSNSLNKSPWLLNEWNKDRKERGLCTHMKAARPIVV